MTWKQWVNGDVLQAADQNAVSVQTINRFADATARDAAITSPTEGQFVYLTGTDALQFYDGSSWTATSLTADITGITTAANSSMAGGATSGSPTLTVDVNNTTSATAVAADYVLISDTSDSNATKRALISDITALAGDIQGVTAGTNISGGGTSGTVTVNLAIDAAVEAGSDGAGVDVTLHSTTAGDYAMYDASAAKWILEGTNAATVLDVTDGNVVIADGALSVSGVITATGGVTGNVSGTAATVTGAAQTAITSVGTLSALDVTGALTAGSLVAPLAFNAQTGTTYTFVLADAGKMVTSSNGSAQTVTVPPNSSVAFAIGTQIIVQNIGSANATLAQGSGVTIYSKDSNKEIDGQYAAATLIKTATDAWSLIGALA
jgi:hypothetical protein